MSEYSIRSLMIHRYKSIRKLPNLELRPLNVLIGANGAGKSNFVSFFMFMSELMNQRLQSHTVKLGGARRILPYDCLPSDCFAAVIGFKSGSVILIANQTDDDRLELVYEEFAGADTNIPSGELDMLAKKYRRNVGQAESQRMRLNRPDSPVSAQEEAALTAVSGWRVYHFHDSGSHAGVKRYSSLSQGETLLADAANLAAFLYTLREKEPDRYTFLLDTIRLAVPYFQDFVLEPVSVAGSDEPQINLQWQQEGCPVPFSPHQFSDGTLRFICLAAALNQPKPPETMVFDEPELGLHPAAVKTLASMFRSAAAQNQVIVSTQSPTLLDQFAPEEVIVVEQEKGNTVFTRLDTNPHELNVWLETYSLAQLWEKNILGGRPR
ncbi:MAG: AAA family ATPase [Planctomycetaceae bacterium]|jgi:predicted ATPase|nr:AAA family ATPase [Planctomycetaceae bacterium]